MPALDLAAPASPQSAIRNPQSEAPQSSDAQRLKIVFVGHVDHGKSTLIGRIFNDTNSLPEGKIEQIQKACAAEGMEFEYSFLLDALLEEQEQNITIDTTQIQFQTDKRNYVIIDAPGHKEFLKNMITGAANADAAVLLIAANEGVREQSRRHGYLLSLLGIKQVVVAVNKMDLVEWSQDTFNALQKEYTSFLAKVGLEARLFVPVSARNGDNVKDRSSNTPWYSGPTIIEALDRFDSTALPVDQPLRFPIQDVYRFDARRILAGRVETGSLNVGDTLVFSPGDKTGVVASIENWNGPLKTTARAGESIGITLKEQLFIERGHIASHAADAPIETNRFKARLFWMGRSHLEIGPRYNLKLTTQEVDCQIASIDKIIDASTLDIVEAKSRDYIVRNDVAEITLTTRTPLVLDNHDRISALGRFVIVDDRNVAGGGIIFGGIYTDRTAIRSENITWSHINITRHHRHTRNGHIGAVIWLTGLSGSGKSTIAHAVERVLFNRNMFSYGLDGDNIRHGLNSNLGFSPEDRTENIRRVAEVSKLMADAGLIVVTSFISPYRADREKARKIVQEGGHDFVEIFVNAPLEVCEARDPKNLYKRARAGEIRQFTGIDAPYEAPENPELVVNTDRETLDESVAKILDFVVPRLDNAASDDVYL
ncbi:MAG TPA: adenylyl-sulfate kinase [Chthoniobacterales bacterium]